MHLVPRIVPFLVLFVASLYSPNTCVAQDPKEPTCDTQGNLVRVCFFDKALDLDPCTKELQLHFVVGRQAFDNGIMPSYYFTYQVFKDGKALTDEPLDVFGGKYLLTDKNAFGQYQKRIHTKITGGGRIFVKLWVYVQERAPEQVYSGEITVPDNRIVRGVIVGVSHYQPDSGVTELLHADEDARAIDNYINSVAAGDVKTTLLVSDAADSKTKLTPVGISAALTSLKTDPEVCDNSADKWLIFYFSGHGIVGSTQQITSDNEQPITKRYLSTAILDPTKLPQTALSVESLLDQIRDIPINNKLVIFDSCFSGNSFSLSAHKDQAGKSVHNSRKVGYVINGEFTNEFQANSSAVQSKGGDLERFDSVPKAEAVDGRHMLILAAAMANEAAEEGFESYNGNNLVFIPVERETEDQKQLGHSLYTYALLWNLLTDLPEGSQPPSIIGGDSPTPQSQGPCDINFVGAHTAAASDIYKSSRKDPKHSYQTPKIAGDSLNGFPPIPCNSRLESTKKEQK